MTTDYNAIAARYKRAKEQPWRSFIESFTLLSLVGDLSGLSVVDLACGEGYYTRILRRQGAASVVGLDLSEGMIALARAEESARPLGIRYLVGDGRTLEFSESFDLAAAAYLLNYARSRAELDAMCRGIAHCLKPGGRFVTVNSNPAFDFKQTDSFRKYGFGVSAEAELREGTPYTWTLFLDDGPLCLENYFLDQQAHDQALRSAGFREVRWQPPQLSPLGEAAEGRDYWTTFLTRAPVIFLECVK